MTDWARLLTGQEVQALVDGLPPPSAILADVPERRCACCGADMRLLRRDASYCGGACRLHACRARHRR